MSTNSTISVELPNQGGIKTVYCHFDGGLDGVGATLVSDFSTQEKAEALVALGDLRSVAGGVEARHRDRGESWSEVEPRHTRTIQDLRVSRRLQEYNYIFSEGEWHVFKRDGVKSRMSDLLSKEG